MRQITFELLRHGKPNNQLLSPLTNYLALCENHAAVSLQVPFEHNQLLHRLQALNYQLGPEPRVFQLKDTAEVLGDLLGSVPGLIAELNREPPARTQTRTARAGDGGIEGVEPLTHLRLVISASELALLPFELAMTPNGFPGAGQPLLLQPQEPICLTREVRRVADPIPEWPRQVRVLVVCASPGDLAPVPEDAHIKAIRRILEPWVAYADTDDERARNLEQHLVVLRKASCVDVERQCAEGGFSHVHILAHGVQYQDGFDVRFGIALHDHADPDGEPDIVGGERLATIVRAATRGSAALARPLVVTLASCNSGDPGGVTGVGASVAHALHAGGVPMVVASQFPLTTAASIQMVEVLYDGLLWCQDPRLLLNTLRRRLHARFPDTHDWASVTAYLALPPSFGRDLPDLQISQTMRSIDVAMNYADQATGRLLQAKWQSQGVPRESSQRKTELLKRARSLIETSHQRLDELGARLTDRQDRIYGLLGATEKRCAEVYFSFSRLTGRAAQAEIPDWRPLLEQARDRYWRAFLLDPNSSWAIVQYLSLDLLLRRLRTKHRTRELDPHEEHNDPAALWNYAHVLSLNELRSENEQRVRWALGNLIELYLLAQLRADIRQRFTGAQLAERAVTRAKELRDRAGLNAFELYSTRRQILRYADWYAEIADIRPLVATAERLLRILPAPARAVKD